MKFIKNNNKGFTLIELIVVIAIFGILSLIVLFNSSNFKSRTTLDNLAQDMALTIRKVQVFAVGVKGTLVAYNPYFPGYGLHFSLPPAGTQSIGNNVFGDKKSFIVFADIPSILSPTPSNPNNMVGNKLYDASGA